jgi:ligand-binding sensor domain-containing protein
MAGAYSPGSAQFYETRITPITDETGASPGATFAILEDTMGFMWFGTTDGLYRYDGYNYRIFRFDPESENSLSDNTIRGMAYDQKCYLWIATQGGGLDRFNLLTEEFKHYRNTGAQENEISGNSLWALMIDRSGNIWIGVTGKGVDRLDQETNTFTHFNPLTGEKTLRQEQTIRTLVEGKSGVILVGIPDYGLSVINPESGKVRSFNVSDEIGHGLSNSMIYDMLLSDDGKLWICTYGGGINIHNTRKGKFEYLRQRNKINPLLSDLTYAIAMRRSSEIWIGTEYGINCYNPEKGEMRIFKKGEDANFSLSDNRIREIFVDKKGIVWAGSESGVDKIVTNKNFRVFRHSKDEQDGMAEGIVRAILEDDHENLWIGLVENGLVRYDKHSGVYKHYIWDAGVPGSIPGNNINALYQDSEGTLWIGEWWSGLIRYNAKNDAFSNVANANLGGNTLNDNRIQVIREEPPGILWIGTENGINRFNIAKGEFTYFKHEEGNPQSLSGNAIQSNAFIFDHEKNLWAGTWSFGLTIGPGTRVILQV